jgi:hypothetical protein
MMRRDYLSDFSNFLASDLDQLARETKERWQVNCEWVLATLGAAPGLGHVTTFNSTKFEKLKSLGARDVLREYVPHAHRHGIHVLGYINMHWYSYEFAKAHPGWEQIMEDGVVYGRKHPLYGGGTTFCVNSPWRDWAFEMIREVMQTGVDGCFLDGPVIFRGACYCVHCRKQFRAATGSRRLPKFDDWADPLWKRFGAFRADSWARFMKDAQAAAREVNPDAVIFLNGGGFSAHNIKNGYDVERLEPYQSFSGSEEFFHCHGNYLSPFRALNLARFLSAGTKPGVVFSHHGLSTWHYVPLPVAEMTTALAQTVAGGSNTWFAIFSPAMERNRADALAPFESAGKFIAECDPYTTANESAAETAVLLSSRTGYGYVTRHAGLCRDIGSGREVGLYLDSGSGSKPGNATQRREASVEILEHENEGCLDALNHAHVPARILWDGGLSDEALRRIKVLVLPNVACLSEDQIAAIQRFVRNGGGLVATFESGVYDEWGEPVARNEWQRFLGIARIEGVFLPSRTEDYLSLTRPLDGIPAHSLIPRPVNALAIRPTHDADVLALYWNPINKAYTLPRGISKYAAILSARRGKGRVVYIASPLFESFDRFHIGVHKDLARALVQLAAGRAGLQVETNAPGSLAIEVRSQPGRLLVHLVNVTSDMKRPMGEIIPLRDIEIRLRAPRFHSARCLRSGKTLRLQQAGGHVRFQVPVIPDYEIVLLSKR